MATQIPPPPPTPPREGVGPAVQEISFRAQQLVREEIELAKAEVTVKAMKLPRAPRSAPPAASSPSSRFSSSSTGSPSGSPTGSASTVWVGYWITAALLFLLAAVAAFVASRLFKAGSPPKPQMAMDEAQLIKQTVDEARS